MPYLSENKHKDVVLNLYVQPKASRNKIVGLHGEALKICITSPPVDGKANTAMTAFLAKLFKLPKSSVKITGGQQNRQKRFTLHDISMADVRAVIAKNLP